MYMLLYTKSSPTQTPTQSPTPPSHYVCSSVDLKKIDFVDFPKVVFTECEKKFVCLYWL